MLLVLINKFEVSPIYQNPGSTFSGMEECARMNCDSPAVALLTFAPPEAKAWLYDLDSPDPTGGIMLCRKHANATVVPMSWQLVDARDPAWPGPVGSQPAAQAMAAASAEELVPVVIELPQSAAEIDKEFAAMQQELPAMEPELAPAHAGPSGHAVSSGGISEITQSAVAPDPSLFELPISDIPAVTPYPG